MVLVYDVETVEELLSLTRVEEALSEQLRRVVRRRAELLKRLQLREIIQGRRKSA